MHSSTHFGSKQANEIKFIRFWHVAIIVACALSHPPPLWVRQRNNCAPITANPCGLWLTLLWSNMKLKDKRQYVSNNFITSENETCQPLWLVANSSLIKYENMLDNQTCICKLYHITKVDNSMPSISQIVHVHNLKQSSKNAHLCLVSRPSICILTLGYLCWSSSL